MKLTKFKMFSRISRLKVWFTRVGGGGGGLSSFTKIFWCSNSWNIYGMVLFLCAYIAFEFLNVYISLPILVTLSCDIP